VRPSDPRAQGAGAGAFRPERDRGAVRLPVEWAQQQFRQLGRGDARDLALDLLAAYEGSALLANTMRDPGILTAAASRLDRWIDAL